MSKFPYDIIPTRTNLIGVIASVMLLSACTASVRTFPTEVAIPAVPTYAKFGIAASMNLPAGVPLVLSTVNARKAYCSSIPVYFNIGESRGGCFMDNSGAGYFDEFYVLGTLPSSTIDGMRIPYIVMPMSMYQSRMISGYVPPTAIIPDQGPNVMDVVGAAISVGSIGASIHNTNAIIKSIRK